MGSLLLVFVLWISITISNIVDPLFLPGPAELWKACGRLWNNNFGLDIASSVARVFVAFLLSLVIAFPTALAMASKEWISRLLGPYIDFIRYIPVPTLIPLAILFLGLDEASKIVLLFIGTYFQLVLLIIDDIKNIPDEYFNIAFTLNFSFWQLTEMKFRSIAPQLWDNSRITIGWCWTYIVIVELVASETGIGHMIKEAHRFSNTPEIFVGIISMGIIGFSTDTFFKKMSPYLFKYTQ